MAENNETKKTTTKDDKNVYYIGIEDPRDLQKEVLSAAKSVIISLKKYEKIKENRKEKVELFADLNTDIKEINTLLSKLNHLMPETKLRHIHFKHDDKKSKKSKKKPAKEEPKHKSEEKKIVKQKANPTIVSELDKLERELEVIENKLSYANKKK